MKRNAKFAVMGLITPAAALLGMLAASSVSAREPYTKAELADQQKQLLEVVDHGRDLWHGSKASMTTNGLACGNCHPDAAAANPQTFPKFQADLGRVIPLRDMINWCIQVPLAGQTLDVDGPDMIAMEAYAYYMHRGEKLEPGMNSKQTYPIEVKSGPGYPKKGSGIGYDK